MKKKDPNSLIRFCSCVVSISLNFWILLGGVTGVLDNEEEYKL